MTKYVICLWFLLGCGPPSEDERAVAMLSPPAAQAWQEFHFSAPVIGTKCEILQPWRTPVDVDETVSTYVGYCRWLAERGEFAQIECVGAYGYVSAYRICARAHPRSFFYRCLDWSENSNVSCEYSATREQLP